MRDIEFYIKLLIRRTPVMAALILLTSLVGYVVAQRLPTQYSTSATLLVESQQISDDLARSTVRVNASEQLGIIQRQLLTRANLIDIANKVKIFPGQTRMTPDTIVQLMRENTRINRNSGRNQATLMQISFKGENPQKIAAVVNEYVTIVLEMNAAFRTARAAGTLSFFEQEVDNLSGHLDEQSARIVAFKSENSDALPENLEYRLGRQSLLQERLARAERDLESLTLQEKSIRNVYETTGRIVTAPETAQSAQQKRLLQLESELRNALTIYSEQNPRIKVLKRQIEIARQEAEAALVQQQSQTEDNSADASPLEVSLSELSARSDILRQEVGQAKSELERLEDTIQRTPSIGITLEAMQRDLQNTQSLYNAAVQRMSQAQVGERIELSSKGERITVLEAANVPTSPSSPNKQLIMASGGGVGLALAGGWFLLLELLNRSVRRPADITTKLNITPLSSVPRIETSRHRTLRRILKIVTLILSLAAVVIIAWAVDTFYMPIDQLFEQVLKRLGLI